MQSAVIPARRTLRRRQTWKEYAVALLFVLPSFLLLVYFVVIPTLRTVQISFHDWDGVNPEMKFVGLDNYRYVLKDPLFYQSLKNNFIWTIMHLIFACFFGFVLAYFISRIAYAKTLFRNVLFMPNVIALSVSGIIWTLIFNPQMGMLNGMLDALGLSSLKASWLGDPKITIYAISFASSWQAYGYYMTLFLAGLQNIDVDLYEASDLDGANKLDQFIHITIPGLQNVFSFVFSMGIINGLKGFSTVWVMTQGGPGTSSYLLTLYGYVKAFREQNYGQSMVSGIVLGLMIIVITRIFNAIRDRYAA